MKKLWLWVLIFLAASTAFYLSFQNSIEMASMAECDDGSVLRVVVRNEPPFLAGTPLLLKIEHSGIPAGTSQKNAGNQKKVPFLALLIDSQKRVVARLGEPDEQGNVPAIENVPRDEKYLWIGFPRLKSAGAPPSLLIKNPFYAE